MFARLVTTAQSSVSANVFFNTIVGLVSNTITSTSQLDPSTFNTAACSIVTTVPAGWSVIDPVANSTPILSGCYPVVIRAPWTDSADNHKYIFMGQTNSTNSVFSIVATPMEGWSNTAKTAANSYIAPALIFNNNSTYIKRWHDVVSPMTSGVTYNGTTTIVSASQAHLLVASYLNLTGTSFNNYFHVSEYSRDDPWNTVSNGYPSWFAEGNSNTAGDPQGIPSAGTATGTSNGVLMRVYNTATNEDRTMVAFANNTAFKAYSWGIIPRYTPHSFAGIIPQIAGLGFCAHANTFLGNQNYNRDSSKNAAASMSELRVVFGGGHLGGVLGVLSSNSLFAGGSINSVAPYVYAFKSQWQSLDEVDYGGYRYMNLILNTGSAGTTAASTVLVKEV